jgi:hypothetical protein
VTHLIETTSATARKLEQEAKEARIRGIGGTYVKAPGRKGKLYDIK